MKHLLQVFQLFDRVCSQASFVECRATRFWNKNQFFAPRCSNFTSSCQCACLPKEKNDYTESGRCTKLDTDALDEMGFNVGNSLQNQNDLKYIKLARNSNQVPTFNEKSVSVRMSGPTGSDRTRTGNIGIWHLMHWFGAIDTIVLYTCNTATGRTAFDLDKIYANRLIFVASIKCTVTENLYKQADASEPTPFSVESGLHNIGNSSLGTASTIRDESGRDLAHFAKQVVLVDETSRKPVSIPDWWKKMYGSHVKENKRLIMPELIVPAEDTYKYIMKVSWNDIDGYKHVNFYSYLRFCFDAAMDAVKHGFYIGFFDDILKYNVKTLRVKYINEALEGDSLTVVTWQNIHNPRIINFSIEREGKVLVQISMEFFLLAHL